ncbi:MAG TPA: SRPBCC domain-containing protein, partial [bacterium]|nr:SRPBCC domain-containing protein [bacterium]
PHPPAKVWRALTEPKLVAQWLMDNDMPAVTGKAFTFRTEPMPFWDGIVHSEILELEPQKRLRYTWKGGPGKSPLDTVVTWTLIPVAGGTRLELEHSGFKTGQGQAFGGARQGWDRNVDRRMAAVLAALN